MEKENLIAENNRRASWNMLKQYQYSLQSSNNMTSSLLLSEHCNQHNEWFNNNSRINDFILNKRNNNYKASTWRSSLRTHADAELLFANSIPPCLQCSNKQSKVHQLEKFLKNSCKCELERCNKANVETKNTRRNMEGPTKLMSFKSLKNETGNVPNKDEDVKATYKARFGQPRAVDSTYINTSNATPIESEAMDQSLHTSNVNKIIFKSAREQLLASNPAAKRTIAASRKAQGKFVSPMITQDKPESTEAMVLEVEEPLKHLDPKMVELIESEIIDKGTPIGWDDIAGLQMAKSVLQEAVVYPLLRPDIFTGLRRPPRGILLFGPPGTGKTLIGRCVAAQCQATFFSISASSLTSKWIGDGEKMVRTLFAVARCRQPSVIFIDEIDSLLTQRSDSEHEATRRIKTEFLVQFDGASTDDEDRLLVVGATNRPHELDEAARRRLVKRLYIPLPDKQARKHMVENLVKNESNNLVEDDMEEIAVLTEGYSGADMKSLCSEAAMGPIRSVPMSQIISIHRDKVRPVNVSDFTNALKRVKPSVSQDDLGQYVKWNNTYGQGF